MKTPDKICLIDTGDEIAWCDSVPSNDIPDEAVVWYERIDPSASKVIEAAIRCKNDKDTLVRYKATSGDVTGTGCIVNLFKAVIEYQKVTP